MGRIVVAGVAVHETIGNDLIDDLFFEVLSAGGESCQNEQTSDKKRPNDHFMHYTPPINSGEGPTTVGAEGIQNHSTASRGCEK